MEKCPCVYILASRRNGTLYIGVTSNLLQRVWQHKNGALEGFSKTYGVHTLVWFELHPTMLGAIQREKGHQRMEEAMEAQTDRSHESRLA